MFNASYKNVLTGTCKEEKIKDEGEEQEDGKLFSIDNNSDVSSFQLYIFCSFITEK